MTISEIIQIGKTNNLSNINIYDYLPDFPTPRGNELIFSRRKLFENHLNVENTVFLIKGLHLIELKYREKVNNEFGFGSPSQTNTILKKLQEMNIRSAIEVTDWIKENGGNFYFQKFKNEAELLFEICKCWNNLDTKYLEPILASNVEYTSQWVFESIIGKQKYIDYLNGKFSAIKNDIVNSKLYADIGYFKGKYYSNEKPCLVLTQYKSNETVKVSIVIEHKKGLINKIAMCGIPNPNGAELFEIYAK